MATTESKVTERRIQSRNSRERMQAARTVTYLTLLLALGIVLLVYGVVAMAPGDTSLIVVSVGLTMATVGIVGAVVHWQVLQSFINSEDSVKTVEYVEAEDSGPEIPLIGNPKPGSRNKTLLVGPTRLTVDQWRRIYRAIVDEHGSMSRRLVDEAAPGIKNLNAKYGELSRWMLEKGFIEDRAPNKSYPDYWLLPPGYRMFEEVIAGKSPGG